MWSPYPPITPPHPKVRALPALIRLQALRDVVFEPPASLQHGRDPGGALDHLGCPVDTKENVVS
eukprot:6428839-Pyramimonas_sp.AAC.1